MIYAHSITREIFDPRIGVTAPDGTAYPPGFPPEEIPCLRVVTPTQPPGEDHIVTGWHVSDDFVQVWDATSVDPASIARANILGDIDRLEALETPRRIAEAMSDEAGGNPDGRAWLAANRAAISALRSAL